MFWFRSFPTALHPVGVNNSEKLRLFDHPEFEMSTTSDCKDIGNGKSKNHEGKQSHEDKRIFAVSDIECLMFF